MFDDEISVILIKHSLVSLLYILLKLGMYNLMMVSGKSRNM